MQVSGKVNRPGPTNIAADAKAVNRSPAIQKVTDALQVNAAANQDADILKAG